MWSVSNDCSIIVCRRGLKKNPIVQVLIVVVEVSCYGQQSSVVQNNKALGASTCGGISPALPFKSD